MNNDELKQDHGTPKISPHVFSTESQETHRNLSYESSRTLLAGFEAWLLATRPKTLIAAILPVLVSAVFAQNQLRLEVPFWIPGLALVISVLIQVATNWINDAKDFEKGADKEDRLGPARAAAMGWISSAALKTGAFAVLLSAVALSFPLVLEGGWPIVVIGVLSCLLAYSYTGGPFPLAYKGLGEVFVFLFFGLIPVGGMMWLLGLRSLIEWRTHGPMLFDLGSILGLLSVSLILINNLRDRVQDAQNGKKTLVVRLGTYWSHAVFLGSLFVPYLIVVTWALAEKKISYGLPLGSFPIAAVLAWKVVTTIPSRKFNTYLGMASLHAVLFCGLLIGSLVEGFRG